MTLEEAQKLASIAITVDGGCLVCVHNVVEALNEAFPEFVWEQKDPQNYDKHRVEVRPK